MQLLGRAATRVKPGSGKKMPVIVDFMNDPTWIFEAAARFFEESRMYLGIAGSGGEMRDQVCRLKDLLGGDLGDRAFAAAKRLKRADQATLMASALRHIHLRKLHPWDQGALDNEMLKELLRELNVSMKDSLWVGSQALAERAMNAAIFGERSLTSRTDLFPTAAKDTTLTCAQSLAQMLRPLRRLAGQIQSLRSRSAAIATPARKRSHSAVLCNDIDEQKEKAVLSAGHWVTLTCAGKVASKGQFRRGCARNKCCHRKVCFRR